MSNIHDEINTILDSAFEAARNDGKFGQLNVVTLFRAYGTLALSLKQITGALAAIHGAHMTEEVVQKALTGLVRKKYFRSRVQRGTRLYELKLS